MKTFEKCAAQGDLLIREISEIPSDATPVSPAGSRYVVAHSETGHDHVINERPNVFLYASADRMVSYLRVIEATDEAETVLEHMRGYDRHESIALKPGMYEIRRQREYTPLGWRAVQD